jgi:hypothetical protein
MDDMKLPVGKTCSDCRKWSQCKRIIGSLTGKETICDWAPSRFEENNESLLRQIEALQNEKTELMNDLQRIHERAEEALADQPDNYASFLAVTDIQELTAKRAYPPLQDLTITLRPEVQWFAEQMELALQANDHKLGWKDCSKDWLNEQLHRHTRYLLQDNITRRAANVANFAMMIADNARGAR